MTATLPRKKGRGGHWQVLVNGEWIGERIVEIASAIEVHGSRSAAAEALGLDLDAVSKAHRRWVEVMGTRRPPEADALAGKPAVEVPRKPSPEEWAAPVERRPMEDPVEPPRTRPIASATELEALARAANGHAEPVADAAHDVGTESHEEAAEAEQAIAATLAELPELPEPPVTVGEIEAYSYDRGFAIGWMAAVMTIVAASGDSGAGLRTAAERGLQLLEKAP